MSDAIDNGLGLVKDVHRGTDYHHANYNRYVSTLISDWQKAHPNFTGDQVKFFLHKVVKNLRSEIARIPKDTKLND